MDELAVMGARVNRLETLAEASGERLDGIDALLSRIEMRLIRIEARQDEFLRHFASKADLIAVKNSILLWTIGAAFLAQLLSALLQNCGHA